MEKAESLEKLDKVLFGERVQIQNKLVRKEERIHNRYGVCAQKIWKTKEINTTGIFLGYRTLSNGKRSWYSDHVEYIPTEYITVALVCISPNKNPFYTTLIS